MNKRVQYKIITVRKFYRNHSTFIKIIIDNIPGNVPTELWLCFISLTGETTKNFNPLRPEEGEEEIDEEEEGEREGEIEMSLEYHLRKSLADIEWQYYQGSLRQNLIIVHDRV